MTHRSPVIEQHAWAQDAPCWQAKYPHLPIWRDEFFEDPHWKEWRKWVLSHEGVMGPDPRTDPVVVVEDPDKVMARTVAEHVRQFLPPLVRTWVGGFARVC